MTALAAVALLFAGAFVKGILGLGLPMIAIPGLTLLVGLPQALAICVLPVALANAWQVWQFRKTRVDLHMLAGFVTAGAVGVAIGSWLLVKVPPAVLEMALATMLILYLGLHLRRSRPLLPPATARQIAPGVGIAAGLLHGATGIAGPIGITFFHSMRLPRPEFIFATGVMFLCFATVQLPLLQATGILGSPALATGLLGLPAVAAGLTLGHAAARRIDARMFDRLVLVVLTWTALTLLWRAAREVGMV
ncbi:sulfite exporter TauE/SafE family protein [Salipiger marinus]|uniref:sulfite exporter TauE/SafE family protein n=1 Tax=Salipiger marinus TaxID=555512 RepID=UPI00405A42E9